MEFSSILLVVAAVVAALGFFFFLRRPGLNLRSRNLVRIVIFFSIISWLSYDFYSKGKYSLLFVLALGSIAFVSMILRSNKKGS